jgi:hypothetical protein
MKAQKIKRKGLLIGGYVIINPPPHPNVILNFGNSSREYRSLYLPRSVNCFGFVAFILRNRSYNSVNIRVIFVKRIEVVFVIPKQQSQQNADNHR